MSRLRQLPLRTRLVVAALALTAAGLIAANTAGALLLRSYLTDRVDRQLTGHAGKTVFVGERPHGARIRAALDDPAVRTLLSARFGDDTRIVVYRPDGTRGSSYPDDTGSGPRLPSRERVRQRQGEPFTVPDTAGGADWRANAQGTDGTTVVTAISLEQVSATTARLLVIDGVVMAVVLTGLGAAAAFAVRVGMRPLNRMEATAAAITAGDFSRRVPDTDPHTEAGRLGSAMNAMLGRIEEEITARRATEDGLRRFLADASHELRTPLTSIRGFAELARRGGDPAEAVVRIGSEAERMAVLVEDLLLLARLDEQRPLEQRPVDLLELAAELVRDAAGREPARTVLLEPLTAELAPVTVCGDALRLRQVGTNLLANALRHTPPETTVRVRTGSGRADRLPGGPPQAAVGPALLGPVAVVEIADDGPGIPAADAPRVFERLYRADPARSPGGAGLGLAIVAAIVTAHGGRTELRTGTGQGAAFRVLLPIPDSPLRTEHTSTSPGR